MDSGKEKGESSEQSSVYSASFQKRASEPRHLVHKSEKETHIEGNIGTLVYQI